MTVMGRVVEEGLDSPPPRDPSNSGWLLAVVGFALGLGIGVLAVGRPPPPLPEPGTPLAVDLEEPVDTTAVPEDGGVSVAVDGFADALAAVSRSTGSSLQHLLWPPSGKLNIRPMAGADEARFDRSGLFLALSNQVPGSNRAVLSMGRFNQISTIATDVTGYAWHDAETGLLAYTTESEGVWRLQVAKGGFASRVILEAPAPAGKIVAWGDWGWAIQSSPSQVTLLNADGQFKDQETGTAYDSRPDGWLFVVGDRPKLLSAGGGVQALDVELGIGRLVAASFSPDGHLVALAGERGVNVLDLDSQSVQPLGGSLATEVSWSSDSRFVMAPAGSGVVVHDTHTASTYQVFAGHSVLAVAVLEASGS
jgi:hypothetical protein